MWLFRITRRWFIKSNDRKNQQPTYLRCERSTSECNKIFSRKKIVEFKYISEYISFLPSFGWFIDAETRKKSIKTRRAWAEVEASKPIMRQIAKPTPGSRQTKTIRLDASLEALFALLLTFRHLAGILISTFRPQVRERSQQREMSVENFATYERDLAIISFNEIWNTSRRDEKSAQYSFP